MNKLIDDTEIERYGLETDWMDVLLLVLTAIVIALVLWTPDVEAIGSWIYAHL